MSNQLKNNLDPDHYHKNSSLQYSLAQDPLNGYPFVGNERVLDVGCGDGKITADIALKVPQGEVIGIDHSPAMIAYARANHPKIHFETQDAAHLSFKHPFDLITCFSCLHWVKDPQKALENMKNLLKKEGKAIIVTYPRCPTFWDPIDDVVQSDKWKNYFIADPRPYSLFSEKDYRTTLHAIGFEILALETTTHLAKFQGKVGFQDYVKGWLPYLNALPLNLHDLFLNEIGNKSLQYVPLSEDGYLYHPYEKIVILVKN